MIIPPVACARRSFAMLSQFVSAVGWLLMASQVRAAAPVPVLSVPATDQTLQVAIALPGELRLDAEKGPWLLEMDGASNPVWADVVAGPDEDDPRSSKPMLVASIPPAADAQGRRQYRLLEKQERTNRPETGFVWSDVNDKSLGLWESKRPVLVYNHGVLSKTGVPADRNRSTYIHPIYGLDGEVLTDDFPRDHYHHRGLFWAWPHVRIEGKNYDLWDIRGIHQRFERWMKRQAAVAAAVLGVQNGWYVGDEKMMEEWVWLTVFPKNDDGQVIDVDLTWVPRQKSITLEGAEDKSYGGLTLRFAPRTGTVITTPLGSTPEDLAMTRLPWADLTAQFAGAPQPSGAAIFVEPHHPDYPPTWLTRHYGVLCVGWPGVTSKTFQPGEPFRCRYRVWIHRGVPAQAQLARGYEAYRSVEQVYWQPVLNR